MPKKKSWSATGLSKKELKKYREEMAERQKYLKLDPKTNKKKKKGFFD